MPRPLLISSQEDYLIWVFLIEIHIFNDKQCRSRSVQKPTDLDLHCLPRQGMTCSVREGLKGTNLLRWRANSFLGDKFVPFRVYIPFHKRTLFCFFLFCFLFCFVFLFCIFFFFFFFFFFFIKKCFNATQIQ